MRILHVVHQFYPEHVGGTEAHTRSLATAQQDAGHDVTVFCRRYADGTRVAREELDGLQVVRAVDGPYSARRRFTDGLRQPFLARALTEVISSIDPDVVHVQHVMGLPSRALAHAAPRATVVATLHDYWWVCANAQAYTGYGGEVCGGPKLWLNCARCGLDRLGMAGAWPAAPLLAPVFALRNAAVRHVRSRVDAWIAPTRFVRDWHVRRGWPGDRTVVIGHGIDPPSEEARAAARARPFGAPARRFAYLGGLSAQKGVHLLVDAFRDLPPDASLTIAGDDSVFPDYCRDLAERAAHPGIRLVGLLSHADVWRTLATIDALVVPSLWYETSSLIAQEALAIGTPVITTDHGALAERVQHGVNGLRVPPGDVAALADALLWLASDAALVDRLRSNTTTIRTTAQAAGEVEALYLQAATWSKR